MTEKERKYLPTYAELVDRLSIVLLKSIYLPEHRAAYREEMKMIKHDLGARADIIYAVLVLMLTNNTIWINESKARAGGDEQDKLLKFTHSINGVRTQAKNRISQEVDERVDLKVDCYAASLPKSFGNWNVFD